MPGDPVADGEACGQSRAFDTVKCDQTIDAVVLRRVQGKVLRGLAGVRANRYGAVPFDHWVLEANAGTAVVVQIETAGALNALDEIVAVKDVDVLFVGPNDLSQALGVPGHYDDPRYIAAVERVGATAREHGKAAGIMLRAAAEIPALRKLGYTVFTTSDRALFSQSARAWRASLVQG